MKKRTLLILHGWGANHTRFSAFSARLKKVGWEVVVPDLPGFGDASLPTYPWGLDQYVEWVQEYIVKHQLDDFAVLGHSFGGSIAVKLARQVDFLSLVLVAPSALRSQTRKAEISKFLSHMVKPMFKILPSQASEWIRRKVYYRLGASDYYRSEGVMREIFQNIITEDLTNELPHISTQTLIIWGDKDDAVPLSDGKRIAELIPNSELAVIKGGHNEIYAPDEQTFTMLQNFLSK